MEWYYRFSRWLETGPPPVSTVPTGRRPFGVVRRQWATILLAIIGTGFVIGAIFLYPNPTAVYRPPFYIAEIELSQSASRVEISVTHSSTNQHDYIFAAAATAVYRFSAPTSGSTGTTSKTGDNNHLLLYLPPGVSPTSCRHPSCIIETRKITAGPFRSVIVLNPAWRTRHKIRFSVTLGATHFAWDENGVEIEAQLPSVALLSTNSASTLLLVDYHMPDAQSYDWTNGPTDLKSTWLVANAFSQSATPTTGIESSLPASGPGSSSGVNGTAMRSDSVKTFAAGALLGLAGAALIGAIQEAISAERRNRDERRFDLLLSAALQVREHVLD